MVIDDLIEIAEKERSSRKKYVIRCCMAAGCMSSNSKGVKEALDKAASESCYSKIVSTSISILNIMFYRISIC